MRYHDDIAQMTMTQGSNHNAVEPYHYFGASLEMFMSCDVIEADDDNDDDENQRARVCQSSV